MINVNKNLNYEALDLNPQEKIVGSLNKPEKNIRGIWLKEAKARLEAHRSGVTIGIPVENVFTERL